MQKKTKNIQSFLLHPLSFNLEEYSPNFGLASLSLSPKMAAHLCSTLSPSSCLHSRTRVSQPPHSCATKLFSGLKLQSTSSFGTRKLNSTSEFFRPWNYDSRPTREHVRMMAIGIPRVPYRNPGEETWQWVDLWSALYRERIICIGRHIDEDFSNQLLATLLYLDGTESKRILIYINSPGGDLTPSLVIFDIMQILKSPVATTCLGFAYDQAALLLAAGEKGNRSAMPHARIALDSPAGAAHGQADDIHNEASELLRIRDYLFTELAKKTGQPLDKISGDLSRTKRFNAQEALEYGLIDHIIRTPRVKG